MKPFPKSIFKNHRSVVLILLLLFCVISVCFNPVHEITSFRSTRAIVSFVILAMIITLKFNGVKQLKLHLVFYGLASVISIYFEHEHMAVLMMAVTAVSISLLLWLILPRIQFKKMGKLLLMSLIISGVINALLLYAYIGMLAQHINNIYLIAVITIGTIIFFGLTITAFIYNNEANSSRSLTFVFFLLFLIFAELLRGAGYYKIIDPFYGQYLARFLMIVASLLLYHFAYLEEKAPVL